MAGRNKPATREQELLNEIRDLKAQITALEKIVARVDPDEVLSRLPEQLDEYSNDLPSRVMALAHLGMYAKEIRAELGITGQQWSAWRTAHQAFFLATSRAKDLAGAHWQRLTREAMTAKDWKFPYSQLTTMLKALNDDDQDIDRGDASQLVIMNVAKGREAAKAKAGQPTA